MMNDNTWVPNMWQLIHDGRTFDPEKLARSTAFSQSKLLHTMQGRLCAATVYDISPVDDVATIDNVFHLR